MKRTFSTTRLLKVGLFSAVSALALAACDDGNVTVNAGDGNGDPVNPDPNPAPVLLSDLVINTINQDTNATAEPFSINDLDIIINNDADFSGLIAGSAGD